MGVFEAILLKQFVGINLDLDSAQNTRISIEVRYQKCKKSRALRAGCHVLVLQVKFQALGHSGMLSGPWPEWRLRPPFLCLEPWMKTEAKSRLNNQPVEPKSGFCVYRDV